jgi:hypothetical protein
MFSTCNFNICIIISKFIRKEGSPWNCRGTCYSYYMCYYRCWRVTAAAVVEVVRTGYFKCQFQFLIFSSKIIDHTYGGVFIDHCSRLYPFSRVGVPQCAVCSVVQCSSKCTSACDLSVEWVDILARTPIVACVHILVEKSLLQSSTSRSMLMQRCAATTTA